MADWELYEIEKQKIIAKNLSPDEYEKAIQELITLMEI